MNNSNPADGSIVKQKFNLIDRVVNSSAIVIVLAIVIAIVVCALLSALVNKQVLAAMGYFFAQPSDFFVAFAGALQKFFSALIRGALFNANAKDWASAFIPLTISLTSAVPLILAGLSVAVAFRAGLFNIGAQGQLIIGAICAGYVGINWQLPYGLHLAVAMLAAIIGGGLWGLIPGVLKAKSGAHEVIVTIMLNSVALFLLDFFLKQRSFIGKIGYPGKSLNLADTANYPLLLSDRFYLHFGFIVAIVAAGLVWWLLERSSFGFKLKTVGSNPQAALTAGVSVSHTIIITMLIAGMLAGLASSGPVLGTEKFLSNGVASSYGFDAITVALLGRARPWGTVMAGILFGALNASAATMQAAAGIPAEIVQICQAIIVLLIAAPVLVRYLCFLPKTANSN